MSSRNYRAVSSTSVASVVVALLSLACGSPRRSDVKTSPQRPRLAFRDIDFEVEGGYQRRENVHSIASPDEQRSSLRATRVILARGWELGCFPHRNAAEATRFYGDEEIAVSLPDGMSIPASGRLRLHRATRKSLEDAARRDCIARPLWFVEPVELFYSPNGRDRLFSVYCGWGYTNAGVPRREYPAQSRRYYVRERNDVVVEIQRAPLEYPHFAPFPEHVAHRKQTCERDRSLTQ